MKVFAVLALIAFINGVFCDYDEDAIHNYSKLQHFKAYLRQREALNQLEKICPGKVPKLQASINKMKDCVNDIDQYSETLCSIFKNHFIRCSEPVIKVIEEECVPEQAKEIPHFIVQSVRSIANYVCKIDGEHIFELANPCVTKQSSRLMRCERKFITKVQQFKNKMPSKEDFCDFSRSFKLCFQSHLQQSCGNEITQEALLGFYDATFAPCSQLNEIELISAE